jgi:hypothetical protein
MSTRITTPNTLVSRLNGRRSLRAPAFSLIWEFSVTKGQDRYVVGLRATGTSLELH